MDGEKGHSSKIDDENFTDFVFCQRHNLGRVSSLYYTKNQAAWRKSWFVSSYRIFLSFLDDENPVDYVDHLILANRKNEDIGYHAISSSVLHPGLLYFKSFKWNILVSTHNFRAVSHVIARILYGKYMDHKTVWFLISSIVRYNHSQVKIRIPCLSYILVPVIPWGIQCVGCVLFCLYTPMFKRVVLTSAYKDILYFNH